MSEANEQQQPKGWRSAVLEDVCYPSQYGWTTSAARSGSIRLLRTTDITSGNIDWANIPFCEQAPDEVSKYLVTDGDLLVSRAGSVRRSFLVTNPPLCVFASYLIRFRPQIDARFIHYFMQTADYWEQISDFTAGIAIPNVNASKLARLRLPIAPLAEQSRISNLLDELLSDLDAGVAALQRVRAKLKLYRASVLKAAVEGALTTDWRARHPQAEPASELLHRILVERRRKWEEDQLAKFKANGQTPPKHWKAKYRNPVAPDSDGLTTLPDGWCWATVEQAGDVRLGRQRAPQHHDGDHMRPYLRVANVYEDRLDLRDVKKMNFTPEEFVTYELRNADILLNEGQSPELVGRPAMYRDEVPGCCYQKTLLRFRAYSGVSPHYALLVYRSFLHSGRFRKSSNITTSIAHLAAERFVSIEFPLPSMDEQEAIVEAAENHISVIDHLNANLDARLKACQSLRQSILRHAFTGQLVPQDPNDEPAPELLKRIAAERATRTRDAASLKRPVRPTAKPASPRRGRPRKALEPA